MKITVRQTSVLHLIVCAAVLGIGVLLGLLIGKIIFLILLMIPGIFYASYLLFWVLELDTETGIFSYSKLFNGVRTFSVSDIRTKRITDGRPPAAFGEQYEIYVYKKGEGGMSERICMPLGNAKALREFLEHAEGKKETA